MNLPDHFSQTIHGTFGEVGRRWLADLPMLIDECARRWSLTVLSPVENLSYNYVAPAVSEDGTAVMLKIGVPRDELHTEMASLELCNGSGAVKLLTSDPEWGVLLLERLQPGTSLVEMFPHHDGKATRIAAAVMREFWQPVPHDHAFPTVYDWSFGVKRLRQAFNGDVGPFPKRLVEQAEALFAELLPSMDDVVVLHGDLHHDNILSAGQDSWLAIDPKGVIGEPAYEAGALLRNPLPAVYSFPNLHQLCARRVDILAETLGLDRQRLIGWGIAQALLSSWWDFEDNGEWRNGLLIADALSSAYV